MISPAYRPNGSPCRATLDAEMWDWLCKGGINPEEAVAHGISVEALVLLWNIRHEPSIEHPFVELRDPECA